MVDYRTNYAKEVTEVLYEHYGNKIHIFDAPNTISNYYNSLVNHDMYGTD